MPLSFATGTGALCPFTPMWLGPVATHTDWEFAIINTAAYLLHLVCHLCVRNRLGINS